MCGADITMFHWRSSGSGNQVTSPADAIVGTYLFEGSANPGTENASYTSGVASDMKSTAAKANKLGTNTLYFAASLTGSYKLQAGDIIYICGYNPFKVGKTVTSNVAGTEISSSLSTGLGSSSYAVGSVIITAEMIKSMGAEINTIYFSRALGSGTGLAAIKIVRPTNECVITYNSNGGAGTMSDPSSPYTKGSSTVTVLSNSFTAPTGMSFVNWNTAEDGSGISYDPGDTFDATDDVTLYAQWAYPSTGSGAISYTLTKGSDAVSGAVTGVSTLTASSTAFTVSTLVIGSSNSKDGYCGQITGHAADYSASQYVALSFNVASGYVFTPSSVGITIFANSTSNMKTKVELTDGVTSVVSNELSCASSANSDVEFADGAFTGKKFKGTVTVKVYQWGVESKRAYIKSPVTISGSVAAELPNTVSFVAGDHGTYTGGDIAQASIGASITLPALTTLETGYNFNGWFTASSEGDLVGAAGASYTPATDITLYAQYSAKSYSITLDDNGGTKDGSATATYNSNKLTSITDPTWAGKAVVGYYKEEGLSNLIADAEGNLQKNTDYTDASGNWNHDAAVTLYAEWSTSHTVTAASNNNTYGTAEAEETSVAEGETTTITASANDGYKFRSWEVTGEGSTLSSTTANPTTLTMGTADATVTATFSALEHYTITYNKGAYGAGDDIAAGDKTEDVAFALSSTRYTRDGYVQTGWALTDGGDKAYDLGGSYTENADLVLYPFWTVLYEQTNVTGAATWDWSKIGEGSVQLTASTTPTKSEEFVLKNIELYNDYTIAGAFGDAQKLKVVAEYPFRNDKNGKMMQGNSVKFTTTVPGILDVDFSNTGGSRPYRYLRVNGELTSYKSGDGNKVSATGISVPAGDVVMDFYIPNASDPTSRDGDNVGVTMCRVMKIVFTPASHSITATPDYYATFCAPYKVSVPDGVEAYTARYSTIGEYTGLLTLDVWTNGGRRVIPANLPVILKGTSTSFVLTATNAEVDDFVGTNNLHGTSSAVLDASTVSTAYVLGVVEDLTGFYKKESGEIPVNKAYLIIDGGAAAAPQVIRIVEGENGATSIGSIEQTEQTVKFVENGRILIKKNGIVYDTLGRIVK